ncbi:MAG: choice-of-anchor tandem repeat GloVer-containing protein [Bacteroidia bacterium]
MKRQFKFCILIFVFAFSFSANAQYTKLIDFNNSSNGGVPFGSLYYDGTFLYGMTAYGGTDSNGIIFKIKPDGTGFVKLLDFSGILNGYNPCGSLIYDGIFFYGMTFNGGLNNGGVIFKIKSDGTGFSKLLDFDGTATGSNPLGSLFSDGTFLYGMTRDGGTNFSGTIFKIKFDGTGFSKLFDFDSTNGYSAHGSLISDGTFLYGMTWVGGISNFGVIFKIKFDGTGYTKLHDFTGHYLDGEIPDGSLITDGTFLYGITQSGGKNFLGTIFKIKFDGTGYSRLFEDFNVTNGLSPSGSLISDGTFLYGMALQGGTIGNGTIFKIKQDGTGFSKLFDFAGSTNGGYPQGSLIFNGTFLYGMTTNGGSNNKGVIFKYDLSASGILEKKFSSPEVSIFPNPATNELHVSAGLPTGQAGSTSKLTVQLFDVTGKEVSPIISFTHSASISTQALSQGIYFLKITDEDNVLVKMEKVAVVK